ncbi:MAG: hypothetical protein M3R38_03975 [Actinomycetota bacterium]|nr:hypothetical protein [Actinomycetota bacterium]
MYEQRRVADHEEWTRIVEKSESGAYAMQGFAAYAEVGGGRRKLITDQRVVDEALAALREEFGWGGLAAVTGPLITTDEEVGTKRAHGTVAPAEGPPGARRQSRTVEGTWWIIVPVDYAQDLHDPERAEFRARVGGRRVVLHARELAEKRSGRTSLREFDFSVEFAVADGAVCVYDDHPEAPAIVRAAHAPPTDVAGDALARVEIPDGALRPLAILSDYLRAYPEATRQAERVRAAVGRPAGGRAKSWPGWCYLPVAAALAVAHSEEQRSGNPDAPLDDPCLTTDAAVLAALLPWRMTKGVYRFDTEVLKEVWSTPIEGEIPTEILYRLPEWSCYVEIPRGFAAPAPFEDLRGFWVHLEWDVEAGHPELRFAFDRDSGLFTPVLNLDAGTLVGCVRSTQREAMLVAGISANTAEELLNDAEGEETASRAAEALAPLVSATLYLCAANAEIADASGRGRTPGNPVPKRVKKRVKKLFAATEIREWDVAHRLGAAIRRARADTAAPAGSGDASDGRKRQRAHVRRAHWHTFMTGPRSGEQTPILKWLPPIAVNVDDADDLPAVVREVG